MEQGIWKPLIITKGILQLVGRLVYQIIYNLYFHPLSKVPGPRLAAISDAPYCSWLLSGRQPYKILELHNKYGHAVRVTPNEVSFNSAESWKDIYTQRPGHQLFLKGVFYEGSSFATKGITSIISEQRPEVHKEMRGHLASAFSERAIVEQEELVAASVDKLVRLVGIRGSQEKGVDMSTIFESMTFDITGDLAFGEAFGALDSEQRHPWIATSLEGLMQVTLIDIFNRYPTIAKGLQLLWHTKFKKAVADVKANEELCEATIRRRIEKDTDRKDFMTRIIEERDPKVVSDKQLAAHASDLVIAGSDTTASSLSSVIYHLLQNPSTLAKLADEVRDTFDQYTDITYSATASMPYLRAVILEAIRVYPPVAFGVPRVVLDGGDIVDGYYLPGGTTVSTHALAACLSPTNFQDPLSFRPERWISPGANDILESSQPWLLGPRGCIGRNLAWLNLRTTIAKLIWVYDLELVDPTIDFHRDSQYFTLWKKPALMVRSKNRGVEIE
ncbi:benzoate 4-monooxygenase cytochrome P450 [Hypoxylon crocopeplum]|nr:benzoate 4-monooxygenase cytochrome P450 [Hypoxylon crocopeplum]